MQALSIRQPYAELALRGIKMDRPFAYAGCHEVGTPTGAPRRRSAQVRVRTCAPGDFDYDGDVDFNDLTVMSQNYSATPLTSARNGVYF